MWPRRLTNPSVIVLAVYNCILTVSLFTSDDYTFGLSHELSWMYGELAGCVVGASASSLKPVFSKFLPQVFTSKLGYSGKSTEPDEDRRVSNRTKITRKRGDAIELESGDESDSARLDDDEVKLWSRPKFFKRGNEHGLTKVQVCCS